VLPIRDAGLLFHNPVTNPTTETLTDPVVGTFELGLCPTATILTSVSYEVEHLKMAAVTAAVTITSLDMSIPATERPLTLVEDTQVVAARDVVPTRRTAEGSTFAPMLIPAIVTLIAPVDAKLDAVTEEISKSSNEKDKDRVESAPAAPRRISLGTRLVAAVIAALKLFKPNPVLLLRTTAELDTHRVASAPELDIRRPIDPPPNTRLDAAKLEPRILTLVAPVDAAFARTAAERAAASMDKARERLFHEASREGNNGEATLVVTPLPPVTTAANPDGGATLVPAPRVARSEVVDTQVVA